MAVCDHLIERRDCADCRARDQGSDRVRAFMAGHERDDAADYGPWIIAAYYGSCAGCGGDIVPGCEIRADGTSGWLCRECGELDSHVPDEARGLSAADPGSGHGYWEKGDL